MVEASVITKVEKLTEWVSNMIMVHSPKKMRICFDHRLLCKATQKPDYQIPTADALRLSHKFVFCLLFLMRRMSSVN